MRSVIKRRGLDFGLTSSRFLGKATMTAEKASLIFSLASFPWTARVPKIDRIQWPRRLANGRAVAESGMRVSEKKGLGFFPTAGVVVSPACRVA